LMPQPTAPAFTRPPPQPINNRLQPVTIHLHWIDWSNPPLTHPTCCLRSQPHSPLLPHPSAVDRTAADVAPHNVTGLLRRATATVPSSASHHGTLPTVAAGPQPLIHARPSDASPSMNGRTCTAGHCTTGMAMPTNSENAQPLHPGLWGLDSFFLHPNL
jgi:hypothetical protein